MKRILLSLLFVVSAFAQTPQPVKVNPTTGAITEPAAAVSSFKSANGIQSLDSDLTAYANAADAAARRTLIGLGNVDNTSDANKPVSTATQTALESKQRYAAGGFGLRGTHGKIAAMGSGVAQLRILSFGDSMSGFGGSGFPFYLGEKLEQAYGAIGGGLASTVSFTGSAGTNATSYSIWPTGLTLYAETGGTIDYGRGGGGAYADKLKVYYIKSPGAGTFKVQSSTNNGSSWSDEAGYTSVDADDTFGLGILSISKTFGSYMLRVVGLSGHVDFLANDLGQLRTESISGVDCASMAVGGLALPDANSSSGVILAAWLADYQPTLGLFEMKESSAIYAGGALTTFQSRMNAGAPLMDWVFILSTPNSTGSADQLLENEYLRAHAFANGYAWLDFYGLYRSWTDADTLGYMADGVHRTALGNQMLVGYTIAHLALDKGYGGASSNSVLAPKLGAKDRFAFWGQNTSPGYPLLDMKIKSGTGNQDVEARLVRGLILADVSGTAQWGFNPSSNNYASYTPEYFNIGPPTSSRPYIRSDTNTVFFEASPYGTTGVDLVADMFNASGLIVLTQGASGITVSMSSASPVGTFNAWSSSLHLRRDTGQIYRRGGANSYNSSDWVDITTAAGTINVAAGNIAATDVQAALNELDTEKEKKALTATATLDFGSIAAGASEDLTITVSGAVVGYSTSYGLPASPAAGIVWNSFVSATNTVTIRATNVTGSAVDPASATYRATVFIP